MSLLEFMTEEERVVAEGFFGFCWWAGARDDQSPDDPAHALYESFMSGHAADDPTALMPTAKHAELHTTQTLARELLAPRRVSRNTWPLRTRRRGGA